MSPSHQPSKTVWIFNQYINTPEFPGGTRHYDLARELVKKGYQVHLFGGAFHYLLLKEIMIKQGESRRTEELDGIIIHWLRILPYKNNGIKRIMSMVKFYFSLLKEVKLLRKEGAFNNPDIIIGSSVHLFTVMAAYRAAKKMNARFIMEVRDLWPYTLTAIGLLSQRHPLVLLFGWMERFLYQKAELIITLLQDADQYIGQYTDPRKVIWLPNSFNKENLPAGKNMHHFLPPNEKKKLTLLFAGSMNIADNLLLLLSAFQEIRKTNEGIRLILLGDGMDKINLLKHIQDHQIPDVSLLPSVPKNKIILYLAEADILWVGMPDTNLYKYGLSFNKIYDYMAAAKPIVISSPKKRNIILDARCGLLAKAGDCDDLIEKIREMILLGESARQEMGLCGYNYLMKSFTTDIITKKLIDEVLEIQH